MPGGFYRGQAAEYNIFQKLLQEYLGGFGAPGFQTILQNLLRVSEPLIGDLLKTYGHQAEGLGQVAAGHGYSGAAQKGERDVMSRVAANLVQQAIGAYMMPYQAKFGGIPGLSQAYMASRAGAGWEDLAAQMLGTMGGAAAGGFGGAAGTGLAGLII